MSVPDTHRVECLLEKSLLCDCTITVVIFLDKRTIAASNNRTGSELASRAQSTNEGQEWQYGLLVENSELAARKLSHRVAALLSRKWKP